MANQTHKDAPDVPPSRKQPTNGLTQERFNRDPQGRAKAKVKFLLHYADAYSVTASAKAAGVSRVTIWQWRQNDQDFNELYLEARQAGADWYEDKLRALAEKGNASATIFGYRMRVLNPADAAKSGHPDDGSTTVEELAERALKKGT